MFLDRCRPRGTFNESLGTAHSRCCITFETSWKAANPDSTRTTALPCCQKSACRLQLQFQCTIAFRLTWWQYIYCVQTRKPLPDEIKQLSTLLWKYVGERGGQAAVPAMRLSDVIASFCNFRAAVASPSSNLSPDTIVARALSVHDDFTAWRLSLPPYLLCEVKTLSAPDATAYAGYYYTWHNLGFAILHVSSWMASIILHGIVIQQIQTHLESRNAESGGQAVRYVSQMQQSSAFILSRINHICASVRYYMLLCSSNSSPIPEPGSEPSFVPCAASINAILKPLFVAGDSSLCPPGQRAWIVEQLKIIGSKMGCRQASFLADCILEKQSTTEWMLDDSKLQSRGTS